MENSSLRTMYFDEPVFVVGAPRSGTSLVTGALGECGLWLGPRGPGTRANPKGFFENPDFKRQVTKPLLQRLGADPLGVQPLPTLDQPAPSPTLRQEIRAIIERQGYDGKRPWGVKDPKLTLIWPTLLACFPQARWIIVRRDVADVVQSCLQTRFLAYHSADEAFWQNFVHEYQVRLDALREATLLYRETRPSALIGGDTRSLQEIVEWLGLQWQPERIAQFVEPAHWHIRQMET